MSFNLLFWHNANDRWSLSQLRSLYFFRTVRWNISRTSGGVVVKIIGLEKEVRGSIQGLAAMI